MKRAAWLVVALLTLWWLPLLVAGVRDVSTFAIAGALAIVDGAILLPAFIVALRLDRHPLRCGAGWGAMLGALLALVLGVAMPLGEAVACGFVGGGATGTLIVAALLLTGRAHWFPVALPTAGLRIGGTGVAQCT